MDSPAVLEAAGNRADTGSLGPSAPASTLASSPSSSSGSSSGASPVIPAVIAIILFVVIAILLRWAFKRLEHNSESAYARDAAARGHPELWDVALAPPKYVEHPSDAKWEYLMPISTAFVARDAENLSGLLHSVRSRAQSTKSSSWGKGLFAKRRPPSQAEGRLQVAVAIAMPSLRAPTFVEDAEVPLNHGDNHPELCLGFTDVGWRATDGEARR